jgi:hypothetical protein
MLLTRLQIGRPIRINGKSHPEKHLPGSHFFPPGFFVVAFDAKDDPNPLKHLQALISASSSFGQARFKSLSTAFRKISVRYFLGFEYVGTSQACFNSPLACKKKLPGSQNFGSIFFGPRLRVFSTFFACQDTWHGSFPPGDSRPYLTPLQH